jgi:hypothetical protein
MRLSLNHANVTVVGVAESRAGVVPVWSGTVVWQDIAGADMTVPAILRCNPESS